MADHQCQPLLGDDAIRLMILEPAQDLEAPVECSLIHTTLSECDDDVVEHYSALSYVWGDAKNVRTINVEGKDLYVTVNLESALRHLRDPFRAPRVWADAICINQANDDEKTRQVSQMAKVYQTARHTILYLGEATKETDLLLHSIQSPKGGSDRVDNSRAWAFLLERPWFTRVWIYQELMFSSDPWVQCGRVRTRWHHLRDAVYSLDEFDKQIDPWKSFHTLVKERRTISGLLARERNTGIHPGQSNEVDFTRSLLRILDSRRGIGVSDPRDMLFAHLGTLIREEDNGEENDRQRIEVDYSKDLAQVYEDIVLYIVSTTEQLDILSYVIPSPPDSQPLAASWAPNWIAKNPSHPFRRLRDALQQIIDGGSNKTTSLTLNQRNPSQEFLAHVPVEYWWHWTSSTSIFAGLGSRIGTIFMLSQTITSSQASWQLDPSMTGAILGEKVTEHWRPILGPILSKVLEPLTYDRWQKPVSDVLENLAYHRFYALGDSPSNTIGLLALWKLAAHLFLHALREDSDYYPHFLFGRRLGLLLYGESILVPESAREGDIVCILAGDMTVPYVLRPRTSNIEKSPETDKDIRDEIEADEEIEVEH